MKKHLFALSVLATLASAASAQSAVTLYGKIDLGLGKSIGTQNRAVQDAAGSRLGLRGSEELPGGMRAYFHLEHRLEPNTGRQANATRFWQGVSTVGLGGAFGIVNLGRQYTAAYSLAQNVIDPWGGDTVAELRTIWRGGISKTRISDSIRYDYRGAGFNFAASTGEATQEGSNAGPDRPVSFAANYTTGPLMLAAGWEDPANANDELLSLGATYKLGAAKLALGWATGKTSADRDFRSVLLAMTYTIGAGELKAGWVGGKTRTASGWSENRKAGLGYVHNLTKRTFLYANVARDGKVATEKSGYDVGVQHNF